MLHFKPIEAITEADLLALITEKVEEGQMIDYKRAIDLSTLDAKAELLRDISSFANASGGDLVYGMEEKKRIPTDLVGLANPDFDRLEPQILQICRAHVDPPISGMRLQPIKLSGGNSAFIIRIPKTWNGPHMVMMDGENRCWTRDHSGKRKMDVADLKQAIAYSEGAAARMKRFRMERIGDIVSRETPIPLSSTQAIVLHLLPLTAFVTAQQVDVLNISDADLPVLRSNSNNVTYSLEGKIAYSFNRNTHQTPDSYTLLFRNGIMEAICSKLQGDSRFSPEGAYFAPWHTDMLVKILPGLLKVYKNLNMPLPVFGAVSLTGVKGFEVYPSDYSIRVPLTFPLQRDILALPEFLIEDYDTPADKLLDPTFDIWWQACGWDERKK